MATKEEARVGVVSWLLGKLFGGLLALVKTWGVTLLWLLLVLYVFANVDKPLVFLAMLAAIVGLIVVLWFLPGGRGRWAVPFYGDVKKWRHRKVEDHARTLGHHYAVALGLVEPIPEALTSWAFAKPQKRLPGGVVRATDDGCTLRAVQTIPAITEQILKKAEAFAPTIGMIAEHTTVERPAQSQVLVRWRKTAPVDRLAQSIDFPVSDAEYVDVDAPLVVGRADAGGDYRLPVFGRMTLLVGSSGAGKGSVIWSVLLSLAPAIRQGTVRVWGIDLKGGVEFTAGAGLFHRIAYTYDEARDMLGELRETLDDRLTYMREYGSRKHVASEAAPYELLLIDEAASLTYLAPDTKTKSAVDADLRRILSTARAAGIAVFAALQDPRKEALTARDLFTQMVGLRLRSRDDAQLALGGSAYEAGARCELIPQSQPGTGYAIDAESGEVVRFRAFWCSDEAIQGYAARYGVEKATAPEIGEVQA